MNNLQKIKSMSKKEVNEFINKCVIECYACPAVNYCFKSNEEIPCDEIIDKWLDEEAEE